MHAHRRDRSTPISKNRRLGPPPRRIFPTKLTTVRLGLMPSSVYERAVALQAPQRRSQCCQTKTPIRCEMFHTHAPALAVSCKSGLFEPISLKREFRKCFASSWESSPPFSFQPKPSRIKAVTPRAKYFPSLAHWAITLLGLAVAGRLAWQAFGRAVSISEVPTFPRYMTSRQQYRLGSFVFVLFSCSIFLLLVHEHRDVIALAPLLPVIPESLLKAAKEQSAPYLVVIAAMGTVYLYLLTKEAQWNVLLMTRDVIHSWISVPQLAKQTHSANSFCAPHTAGCASESNR